MCSKNSLQFMLGHGLLVTGNCHSAGTLCANPSTGDPSLGFGPTCPRGQLLAGASVSFQCQGHADLFSVLGMLLVDLGLCCCSEQSAVIFPTETPSPGLISSATKLRLGPCTSCKRPGSVSPVIPPHAATRPHSLQR